jgi:hypothetical protein
MQGSTSRHSETLRASPPLSPSSAARGSRGPRLQLCSRGGFPRAGQPQQRMAIGPCCKLQKMSPSFGRLLSTKRLSFRMPGPVRGLPARTGLGEGEMERGLLLRGLGEGVMERGLLQ